MKFRTAAELAASLELALENNVYEDLASKFFEHFVRIADAMNNLGGSGLWGATDGFYYDQLKLNGQVIPLRSRSFGWSVAHHSDRGARGRKNPTTPWVLQTHAVVCGKPA